MKNTIKNYSWESKREGRTGEERRAERQVERRRKREGYICKIMSFSKIVSRVERRTRKEQIEWGRSEKRREEDIKEDKLTRMFLVESLAPPRGSRCP